VRKLHFILVGVGGLGLFVSLGAPWWYVSLETGVVLPVSGLAVSPPASSLLSAAAAAFLLGLLLRGLWRRAVAALSTGLIGGALALWIGMLTSPELAARGDLTSVTGLAGNQALSFVSETTSTGFLWVGLGAAVVLMCGFILGIFMPDGPPRASRYEIHDGARDSQDPVVAWDRLSSGDDPTDR